VGVKMKKKEYLGIGILGIFVIVLLIIFGFNTDANIEEMREDFISQKTKIIGLMAAQGDYDCCLEKACMYCIEKTPGHGEGAECYCREDVLNGVHPCGECIGEIMEGHGKPELAPYYAKAIAEKVGQEFESDLQQMITAMYSDQTQEPTGMQLYMEENKQDFQQITCHCGCDHTDLHNCYEEGMLTNCGVCMKEYEDYKSLKQEGKTIKEISDIIDERYGG
jgi:hypothetical protein